MKTELAYDVARRADLPADGLPEVALVGRSNVGKSSLINALLGRRKLARTSGTPGKTRRIHFYRLDRDAYLVDLPGYGYARVSQEERRGWPALVEGYLRGDRASLRGILLLMDVRRDWRSEEQELLAWLRDEGIALRIVLTKADKLSRQRARARAASVARETGLSAGDVVAVSVQSGTGLGVLSDWLHEWLGVRLTRADGQPFA